MKQVVATVLSTLYMTVKPSKPFNPILGETYQGYLSADAHQTTNKQALFKVFAEQTSHHPPVSNFAVENSLVSIFGHFELKGSTSGNSYTIKNQGPCTVRFLDTNQQIKYALPEVVMKGIIWGTTSLQLTNSIIFIDREN